MATFVSDTFSGSAAGTDLPSHTGETGATWTRHASINGPIDVSSAGRLYSPVDLTAQTWDADVLISCPN